MYKLCFTYKFNSFSIKFALERNKLKDGVNRN